ncbi:MAG: hypothetical protein ACYCO3_04985 [Mycobacteriales bacterium]
MSTDSSTHHATHRWTRRGVALGSALLLAVGPALLVSQTAANASETTSITAPASVYANNEQALTVTASLPQGSTSANGLYFALLSGPDANPSQPFAGHACPAQSGQVSPYAGPFTCTFTPAHGSGIDVMRIFDDTSSSSTSYASGEPYTDVTITVSGPASDLSVDPSFFSSSTPITRSASVQICVPYSVSLTDAQGRPVVGAALSVSVAQTASGTLAQVSGNGSSYAYFCDPTSTTWPAAQPSSEPAAAYTAGSSTVTVSRTESLDTGTGSTGVPGQLSFGVASDTATPVQISIAGDGLSTAAVLDVNPGGAAAVKHIVVTPVKQTASSSPATDSAPSGGAAGYVQFQVTLTDAYGDPVGGVYPSFASSGTDTVSYTDCTSPTDQTGSTALTSATPQQWACSYQVPTSTSSPTGVTGKDTIEVYVDPSNQASGTAKDGPPTKCSPTGTPICTTITATIAAPPSSLTTQVYCNNPTSSSGGVASTQSAPCPVPAGVTSTDVTLSTQGASGNLGQGYLLQATLTPVSPSASTEAPNQFSVSPQICVTDANGNCVVTVTNTDPADGDEVTIGVAYVSGGLAPNTTPTTTTGYVAWSATATSAGTLSFVGASGNPSASALTQAESNPTVNDELSFMDPNGQPVSGAYVVYAVSGRNPASTTVSNDSTTYSMNSGQCQTNGTASATSTQGTCFVHYTDAGQTSVPGVDNVTATYSNSNSTSSSGFSVANATLTRYWVASDATVHQVGLDVGDCTGSFSGASLTPTGFAASAIEPPTPDPTSAAPNPLATRVCVALSDSGGSPLFGTPVTLSTSGTGELVSPTGAPLKTSSGAPVTSETLPVSSVTSPDGSAKAGYAVFFVRSPNTGTQNLTATAGGVSAQGQVTWGSPPPPKTSTTTSNSGSPGPASSSLAAVTGANHALWYRSPATPWRSLGGDLIFAPAVAAVPTAGGFATMFVGIAPGGGMWVRSFTAGWHRLADPGVCISPPAAAIGGATLVLSCVGANREVYYTQAPISSGGWANTTGWHSLGGVASSAPAVAVVGGALRFFVTGADTYTYTRTPASGWVRLPWRCLADPAIAAAGTTTVFACQGYDHALWAQFYSGGAWTGWHYLAGELVGGPGVAITTAGAVFYAESSDSAAYVRTMSVSWRPLGGRLIGGIAATGG